MQNTKTIEYKKQKQNRTEKREILLENNKKKKTRASENFVYKVKILGGLDIGGKVMSRKIIYWFIV